MSNFSVTQTKGCTEILQSLSYSDVLALKNTVTNKLINSGTKEGTYDQVNSWTKEEVIRVILDCSQSAEELLKRRKVLREAILTYLLRHEVGISASSDKQQLIDKALVYWKQQEWKRKESADQAKYQLLEQVRKQELERKVKREIEEGRVRKQELERKVKREIEEGRVRKQELERKVKREIEEAKMKTLAQDVKEARRVLEQTRQAEGQLRKQVEEQRKRREQEKMRKQAEDEAKRQLEMQMNIHVTVTQIPPQPAAAAAGDFDCQTKGEAFCQWYFQLLNSQNPLFGRQPEEWGPQHFWEDAVLDFAYSAHEDRAEQHKSAETVSLRLLSLVKDEQLLFNPNISMNGMRCAASPHGLAAIAVAGTIHKNAQCLGIFEQLFGLIRTPVDGNNWKIKYVNLQVKAFNDQMEINQPNLSIQLPALHAHLNELSVFLK